MKAKLISNDSAGAMIQLAGAIADHQKKSTAKHGSCMICGHDKPFAIWSGKCPDAGVCLECRESARVYSQNVAKSNAHQFFQDLIVSLTKHKKKWTATERMQYNRVAKFLTP